MLDSVVSLQGTTGHLFKNRSREHTPVESLAGGKGSRFPFQANQEWSPFLSSPCGPQEQRPSRGAQRKCRQGKRRSNGKRPESNGHRSCVGSGGHKLVLRPELAVMGFSLRLFTGMAPFFQPANVPSG